ncbi:MAG TPA: poly-beta-1,6-N-acetyl-D-glucosamine biosynthesis protein PgaD [Anaeromyxobacteraceae bacterium]|nr:poly-beta-1,6-N-acetyl-D-glucosamine biosynthesis protein PgaD [Anaeromyxobacteraceae bacterium]
MSASLIINARGRLRWHQRLFSDASTVVMWGFWLNLWFPVVRAFARIPYLDVLARRTVRIALASGGSPVGVERYAVALVGTSGTLWLWNQLPAFKRRAPRVESVSDYAQHFELPEGEILDGQSASVCVVHHDDSGRIVRVEPRAA